LCGKNGKNKNNKKGENIRTVNGTREKGGNIHFEA
jgi:hypothetical protein